jgi:oligopeptidase A
VACSRTSEAVKNTAPLREGCCQVLPSLVAASLHLRQSVPLRAALTALRQDSGFATLPRARQRIIDRRLLDARLAGVGLGPGQQRRCNQILTELSALSVQFANNALDATRRFVMTLSSKDEVDGLPISALRAAAATAREMAAGEGSAENGPWCLTLNIASYEPFMRHAKRVDLREALHRAYLARASELENIAGVVGARDDTTLIERILSLRSKLAVLLGFETYATFSFAGKMASSVEEIEGLLETLRLAVLPAAKAEIADTRRLLGATINDWDVAYGTERRREVCHGFTEEQLRSYFPLPRVLEGLFGLAERLFTVRIFDATAHAPRWHNDVRYFEMTNEDGAKIGAFYLDLFARPAEKRHGAWTAECIRRRRSGNTIQLPIAYLCCNQSPAVDGKPALMTLSEIGSSATCCTTRSAAWTMLTPASWRLSKWMLRSSRASSWSIGALTGRRSSD